MKSNLAQLESKYADGGKVDLIKSALDTVNEALTHLQAGRHQQALDALKSRPHVVKLPGMDTIMGGIQSAADEAKAPAGAPQISAPPVQRAAGGSSQAKKQFVKGSQKLSSVQMVPLDRLSHNRVLDDEHVGKVHEAMQRGEAMPPIVIDSGGNILDGNHRAAAATRAGHTHIAAQEVHDRDTGPAFADGGSIDSALPSSIGNDNILGQLVTHMQANPDSSPVLQAHALALLRANLNAAHALSGLSGDNSSYQALSQALSGGQPNPDQMTYRMIAQQMQQGGDPEEIQAVAPAALDAARMAVPRSS